MNIASRFSISNRYIHPLVRGSNSSLRVLGRHLKQENLREVGPDFDDNSTTRHAIAKWLAPVDSRSRIGPSTLQNSVLNMVGGASSMD